MFQLCPKCEQLYWYKRKHVCPPIWTVYNAKYTELIAKSIYADDPELAATIYAEIWDADDYPLLNGEQLDVVVMSEDETETYEYTVTGEMVPTYSALLKVET